MDKPCHGSTWDGRYWYDTETCIHIPNDILRNAPKQDTPKQDDYSGGNYVGKSDTMKASNPKDIIGSDKVPLGLVPPVTSAYLAIGHLEGDLKYGRVNWREAGVRFMIYLDACKRHLDKCRDGEWEDPETLVPHLSNALACISIILDAKTCGKLIDDRPKANENAAKVIDELGSVVKHLKKLHGDKKPVDYFIDGPKQRE